MAKKFLIIVAGIVAVMAAIILVPGGSTQGDTVSMEFYKDSVVRLDNGTYDVSSRETLRIGNDGSARYSGMNGQPERRFTVSSEEMKVLRELFLNTGFMQIPDAGFQEKSGLSNFTRYELSVQTWDGSQLIHWVNPEASSAGIPPIIVSAGSRLDAIIERNS